MSCEPTVTFGFNSDESNTRRRNYCCYDALKSPEGRDKHWFRQTLTPEDSIIVKKIVLAALLAFTLVPAASFAQVYVHVGPPAPIVERPGPPPERGFVWIGGVSPLGWWSISMGAWPLGASTSGTCDLGTASLGTPARWLGARGRALALTRPTTESGRETQERNGFERIMSTGMPSLRTRAFLSTTCLLGRTYAL